MNEGSWEREQRRDGGFEVGPRGFEIEEGMGKLEGEIREAHLIILTRPRRRQLASSPQISLICFLMCSGDWSVVKGEAQGIQPCTFDMELPQVFLDSNRKWSLLTYVNDRGRSGRRIVLALVDEPGCPCRRGKIFGSGRSSLGTRDIPVSQLQSSDEQIHAMNYQ